jgi:amino acid permease
MRFFKLQIIVASVAFLFGAIKGFSFFGGYYQSAFLLSLYAPTISFIVAFAVSKTGLYRIIDSGDRTVLNVLGLGSIVVWVVMLSLHLYFSSECLKESNSCDELKIRDFLVTGIIWVVVPIFYFCRSGSRKKETCDSAN